MTPQQLPMLDLQLIQKPILWTEEELAEIQNFREALFKSMADSKRGMQSGSWAATLRMGTSQFSKCRPEQTHPHHFPTEKIPNVTREANHLGPLQKYFIDIGEPPEFVRWAAERCGLKIEESPREKRIRELETELMELRRAGTA